MSAVGWGRCYNSIMFHNGTITPDVLGGMTPVERAAHLTMRLMRGESLTARQVAEQYSICRKAGQEVLSRMSRVVPIYSDDGVWRAETTCLVE